VTNASRIGQELYDTVRLGVIGFAGHLPKRTPRYAAVTALASLHLAPRLYADAALAHHHRVGAAAAALGTAELQILQRAIALTRIDDRLEVGGALVVAGFGPDEQAHQLSCGNMVRAVGRLSAIARRAHQFPRKQSSRHDAAKRSKR